MELGRKARTVLVLKYLENLSDVSHPLTASALLEKLEADGIIAERKAIYDDIEILREIGYDIENSGGKSRGYYLASRDFTAPEISVLTDAVLAAGFVPKKKTKELVEKLQMLVSVHDAQELKSRICIENRAKSDNDGVYGVIEQLNSAILNRKTVEIVYVKDNLTDKGAEKSKRKIVVCPYALLWDADRYYVIGNNPKYDNLMHLRVDRIEDILITKQPWRHFSEVSEYKQWFDTADYAGKTFNMFGGEKSRIDLQCDIGLFDRIVDRFGSGIFIRYDKLNGVFRFSADALISEGLIGWLMQFGGGIKVLSPQSLQDDVKRKAEEITAKYE